ncbi:hypothetical protein TNIN_95461 [Trichonephila inaurata madagascariensis]|uniref:Uncharacterized protein n=1 Tax=Trichonephila inaurata madagascariensis TaxID=2747483 RepID=A0A8X6YJX9_9ARAC|nr:hypothetical protein TNIN_95461 [Trichonephila inaurata madagascariensis]
MGDSIETSRDAIGDSDCDRIMRAGTRMRRTGSVNSISDSGRPFTGKFGSLGLLKKMECFFSCGPESVGDAQRKKPGKHYHHERLTDKGGRP